ncbi:MAG TPA: hypothetical protein VHJ20_05470 [Polyangia bacterium]|nr:hypothetical protein [Polyangia bacterium]
MASITDATSFRSASTPVVTKRAGSGSSGSAQHGLALAQVAGHEQLVHQGGVHLGQARVEHGQQQVRAAVFVDGPTQGKNGRRARPASGSRSAFVRGSGSRPST